MTGERTSSVLKGSTIRLREERREKRKRRKKGGKGSKRRQIRKEKKMREEREMGRYQRQAKEKEGMKEKIEGENKTQNCFKTNSQCNLSLHINYACLHAGPGYANHN